MKKIFFLPALFYLACFSLTWLRVRDVDFYAAGLGGTAFILVIVAIYAFIIIPISSVL